MAEDIGMGNSSISLQIHASEDRAIVRMFDIIGSRRIWKCTACYSLHLLSSNTLCPEEVFGKEPVEFHVARCEALSFPPFNLNFTTDFDSEKFGTGNEGQVYRCSSHFTQDMLAVKETVPEEFINLSKNSEPRDVTLLAELNHYNIVKFHFAWTQNKTSFGRTRAVNLTCMELCSRNLLAYLNELKTFDLDASIHIFREMMKGIDYMHLRNVAHRDIKPANILLANDLTVKIADFGVARKKKTPDSKFPEDYEPDVFGSLPYCSAEISDPNKVYDQKTDIFSAGIIYFEIFTSDLRQRKGKVDTLSKLIRKGVHNWSAWDGFDLDEILGGTDVLEGWKGHYHILKIMLEPYDVKRPSASEILANLAELEALEDFQENR